MGRKYGIVLLVVVVAVAAVASVALACDTCGCKSIADSAKTGTAKAVNATGNVIYDSVKGVGNAAETVGKATVDAVEATGNALTGKSADKTKN